MRKTFQLIMAVVVSVVVACSMMLGGLGVELVMAENESEVRGSNSDVITSIAFAN